MEGKESHLEYTTLKVKRLSSHCIFSLTLQGFCCFLLLPRVDEWAQLKLSFLYGNSFSSAKTYISEALIIDKL
jgi:hypothetical protein